MMLSQDIPSFEKGNKSDPTFAKTSKRKNYFLAACKGFNPHIDLYESTSAGLIGMDDSQLERIFFSQKLCGRITCFTMRPLSSRDTLMRDPVTFTYWEQTLENF